MKKNDTTLLVSEIEKTIVLLGRINNYHKGVKEDFKAMPQEKSYDLVILADIFADYYTCVETVFVRISKFFENSLDKSQWHTHLLDKMTLEIPNIRKRLLRDETYKQLKEILRFRHFKRYYFEFEYDRDRIEYLEKKFLLSYPLVIEDLRNYIEFLKKL